jgi:hypothetical protein
MKHKKLDFKSWVTPSTTGPNGIAPNGEAPMDEQRINNQ